ncbi:Translation machinery-associated protein 64 [Cyberlindnera fabianii]|uniref:Translation machinery-associated protein 64 n=1 Tax=Cyberlindnera fabianii TaxID=36022 RepID=A0A1V2L468_CYBFA|nr:Translation machinery-associated protein 64 [Cyberlindnera fabianii]
MLSTITELYALPTGLTKECEERIVPSIVKQTTFKSIKGYTGTIYTDEAQTPIWFKTKDSELIPTVYTLWKAPFILPIVKTHPHVIEVLEGGADLMLPGSVPPFPERCLKGRIVAVASTHKPDVVMAVGRACLDLAPLERTIGTKGVAVEVYHTNGDMLYQLAKQKIRVPEEVDTEIQFKPEEPEVETTEIVQQEAEVHTTQEEVREVREVREEEPSEPVVEKLAEEVATLTTEDVDYFFKRSLMQTLTQPPELVLPLQASTFMNHIVNNLSSDDNSIQMKKTSWKKSAKFLKAMEKDGFLKLKGKGDDITVVSAATKDNNEELKNFVPHKAKKSKPAGAKPSSKTNSSQLILTKYYKPTSPVRPILNDLDMNYTAFYTSNEVKDLINKYIAKHELVNPKNKKMILCDDLLKSFMQGKEASQGRDKIMDPILKKFSEHYKITNPDDPDSPENSEPPRKGAVPQVKIITETKIGRKLITRVSNFEAFGIDPEQLSSELKVRCSGSSTIGQNVQNPKLVEVTVQGPHSKIVIDLLTKKYGLHTTWISFEDKSKGKKKK